jgi:hypothetical protein
MSTKQIHSGQPQQQPVRSVSAPAMELVARDISDRFACNFVSASGPLALGSLVL